MLQTKLKQSDLNSYHCQYYICDCRYTEPTRADEIHKSSSGRLHLHFSHATISFGSYAPLPNKEHVWSTQFLLKLALSTFGFAISILFLGQQLKTDGGRVYQQSLKMMPWLLTSIRSPVRSGAGITSPGRHTHKTTTRASAIKGQWPWHLTWTTSDHN